jgi:hypothetical protein
MGMFDYVQFEDTCPKCNQPLSDFQTKDNDCVLDTLHPQDIERFYTSCEHCNLWIEYKVHKTFTLIIERFVEGIKDKVVLWRIK